MPSLSTVPTEILLLISENLDIPSHLSLILSSRSFYTRLLPSLYRRAIAIDPGKLIDNALTRNRLTALNRFIDYGLNINTFLPSRQFTRRWYSWSDEQPTAVLAATIRGSIRLVRWLIERGADVNIGTTPANETPIHVAARCGNVDMIRELVSAGADLEARTQNKWTPLWVASHCKMWEEGKRKSDTIEAIQVLVELGADLEGRAENDDTPLMEAVLSGFVRGVQTLCEAGADVNCIDATGMAVLHRAADLGDRAIIRSLVEHGADVDMMVPNITTGVMWKPIQFFQAARQRYMLWLQQRAIADVPDPESGWAEKGTAEILALLTPRETTTDL
ncbi:ankyrin repeat-containing domain protein [Pyronema omphalodes]|nr:ankyrin repeat-containing domain protein [Pyronema omphalodes]